MSTTLQYPFARPSAMSPAPAYRQVQQTCPVTEATGPYGLRAWLVTRHADVREVLADGRFSWAAMARHGDPSVPLDRLARDEAGILLGTDSPEHDRLRGLVTRHLSARQIQAMEPGLVVLDGRLIAGLRAEEEAGEDVEFNRDFAQPFGLGAVTSLVAELLGFPRRTGRGTATGGPGCSPWRNRSPIPANARGSCAT